MKNLYPFKLQSVCKDYIWGGTRLKTEYNQSSSAARLAECWSLSCHPDGPSVILNGEFAGQPLPEYLKRQGMDVLGTNCSGYEDFPILIKLIDAKDRLSIQVHPDNAYALQHEGQKGKAEMWYVADCEPGASLYYGFDHPIGREEFRRRIENNKLEEVLNRVLVHPGDTFFIEAGTLHAIGAGILIAEIQQNSNLTYRIYDYGRLGADGKPRQLHIEKALDVTRREPPKRPARPSVTETGSEYTRTVLCSCEYFTVRLMKISEVQLEADASSFHSIVCLNGDALLLEKGKPLTTFQKGDSIFIPAGTGIYSVKGDCEILLTTV